eukprot:1968860-Rhodomonas_salina.1
MRTERMEVRVLGKGTILLGTERWRAVWYQMTARCMHTARDGSFRSVNCTTRSTIFDAFWVQAVRCGDPCAANAGTDVAHSGTDARYQLQMSSMSYAVAGTEAAYALPARGSTP